MTVESSAFGWESVTLMNNGLVMSVPVANTMKLKAIQWHVGIMFSPGAQGAANVLANAVIMRAANWANWHYPNDNHMYIALPTSPVFGPAGFAGAPRGGGFGGDGQMFACVPKADAPFSANVNDTTPLWDMIVNAGDGLFFHMDHGGAGPCDAEMQGTIFYELMQ